MLETSYGNKSLQDTFGEISIFDLYYFSTVSKMDGLDVAEYYTHPVQRW